MIYLMMIDTEEDKRKFVVLYEKYRCFMMTVAIGILNDSYLAEDAVHEAFIKVAKNIEKIGKIEDMATKRYLISIVKTTAIDIYRKRNRQQKKEIFLQPEEIETDTIFVKEDIEENGIVKAIYNLPDKYRDIFLLKYSSGFEYSEIADILNITESTVRQRISRGKKILEEILQKENH